MRVEGYAVLVQMLIVASYRNMESAYLDAVRRLRTTDRRSIVPFQLVKEVLESPTGYFPITPHSAGLEVSIQKIIFIEDNEWPPST